MRILLEDPDNKGKWEVMVVPTTKGEIDAGVPGAAEIGMLLLGLAKDILAKHFEDAGQEGEGRVIRLLRPGEKIPPV